MLNADWLKEQEKVSVLEVLRWAGRSGGNTEETAGESQHQWEILKQQQLRLENRAAMIDSISRCLIVIFNNFVSELLHCWFIIF